jgi:hypothetical protein
MCHAATYLGHADPHADFHFDYTDPFRGETIPGSASIGSRVWRDLCAVAGGEGGVPVTSSIGYSPINVIKLRLTLGA